jgi:hypothetical protein
MAAAMSTSLDTLDLLVLELICIYLDDDADQRRNLWAFSMSNRYCYAAAAKQRLAQIHLELPSPNDLQSHLDRWNEILSPNSGHRHVRRLKITYGSNSTAEEKQEKRDVDEEYDSVEDSNDWKICPSFDMHGFCLPTRQCLRLYNVSRKPADNEPECWESLGRFINQFTGLRDCVWACNADLPRPSCQPSHPNATVFTSTTSLSRASFNSARIRYLSTKVNTPS